MKDEVLDALAERANVAQFVSFGPDLALPIRHCRLADLHDVPEDSRAAVEALLHRAVAGTVNVRAFHPDQPKGHDFHYGIAGVADVLSITRKLAGKGLITIVNETIPIDDGGVSGVALGGVVEFAPDDTPRCVEKPGTAAFAVADGLRLLDTVYGFAPDLDARPDQRVEFSIHPQRVGFRRTHTIVWEIEQVPPTKVEVKLAWPNRFSRLLGDKVFGLLVAALLEAPVPSATVLNRRVAPFRFGRPTGTSEHWLRTAPCEAAPGRYTTVRGWQDPFRLLAQEDPGGEVASVIAQQGVDARWSGALLPTGDGGMVVEGVSGTGDDFMLGKRNPEPVPQAVEDAVREGAKPLADTLGPVRMEWVHDGAQVWVVQLQQATPVGGGGVIYPGEPSTWHHFDPGEGLEALRTMLDRLDPSTDGVVVTGAVGVTSHIGDLLRRARLPSRVEPLHQP